MSDEVLESYTRQYIQLQQAPEAVFAWQGGEPTLMGLDFFQRAVELQSRYRRPGMKIVNSFQTNGILLDEAWCRFFRENRFLVGISLDGPAHLHNAYRLDKGGGPTFDRVMRAVHLLQEYSVAFNILACVHRLTAEHPLEVYRFLRDEVRAQFIQFIPIVERSPIPGQKVSPHTVSGESFGRFLKAVFDEWVRRDVGKVYVQHFDTALAAWAGFTPGLCVHEETCGLTPVMEHNGDLYVCDHFVEPHWRLGNLLDRPLKELVRLPQLREFGREKKAKLPAQCRQCRVRFACNGGCPKDRLDRTPAGEPGLNYLCAGYQAFFSHIDRPMKLMARLLRAGEPPARIMERLSEAGPRKRRKK